MVMSKKCGCDTADNTSLMPLSEAVQQLLFEARCLVEAEVCPLHKASGRVLAQDYIARYAVPPTDNSAMDGYALSFDDLTVSRAMRVSQRIQAGALAQPLEKGTCCRIFTGAPIPFGADTVIMQEHVEPLNDDVVYLIGSMAKGDHIRLAGEDLKPGDKILSKGVRLGPAECGVLASQGIDKVSVFRPLKVAVLATGDELIQPGQPWSQGKLFNSNRYTLMAGIESLGMQVIDMGVVKDEALATQAILQKASEIADVIITTGGVSVGEADFVRDCVAQSGHLTLWGVAIKPGKPFAFGDVHGVPFLGLPGNPVASLVTFDVLALPYLRQCQGMKYKPLTEYKIRAGFSRIKTLARQEFLRVSLVNSDDQTVAILPGSQGSGVLSTASEADGYLVIPPLTPIQKGDVYAYLPYSGFRW